MPALGFSQNDQENQNDLKIYLDCFFCDVNYYKQNLSHVEFVRDRKVADVHLLFTRQNNGSGGSSQQIQFIGLGYFSNMVDTLSYSIDVNMTSDEKRKRQLKYIELGLVRYWLLKGLGEEISVDIHKPGENADSSHVDPWDYWVFNVHVGGWANGQETSHSVRANGRVGARRITKKNKFSLRMRYNKNFQTFIYDSTVTTTNQESSWVSLQEILSINDHWSYGFFANAGNSIFSNQRFYLKPRAAIEYNFFNYEESSTKQAVLSYEIGGLYNDYYDTTVSERKRNGWISEDRISGGCKSKMG
jgi:hypothetical protein